MYEVWTVHRWERMVHDVYVCIGQSDNGARIFQTHTSEGALHNVEVMRGAEAPVFMSIDVAIADKLAEALKPRPEATERHLDDALEMRDKLFELVKKAVR